MQWTLLGSQRYEEHHKKMKVLKQNFCSHNRIPKIIFIIYLYVLNKLTFIRIDGAADELGTQQIVTSSAMLNTAMHLLMIDWAIAL